jgi:hypothetical protein
MRAVALLALLFGLMAQLILDGQTFSHALFGIICGMAAFATGLSSARKDPPHRWEGLILAGCGFALGIWCVVTLPSAYRFQQQFNARRAHTEIGRTEHEAQQFTPASPDELRWIGSQRHRNLSASRCPLSAVS